MAYSEVGDLLLGDLVLNPSLDKQKWVVEAANEMDSKLGWLYDLPLRPADLDEEEDVDDTTWTLLPRYEVLTLKGINNKLASGRLILTLDIAGEGTNLHAYGWYLVREAQGELLLLANGEVDLTAQRTDVPASEESSSRTPGIKNYDEESLVLGFENTVMKGKPWYSRPGALS